MTKPLLSLTVCLVFVLNLAAQTIPNGSFETWNAGPGYEDPDQWTTLNPFSTTGQPVTVTKVLNTQSGSYAMQLESKVGSMDTIAATAWLGGNNGRGLPFTQRPGAFNVYTQYFPSGVDTAHIYVEFWKSNGPGGTLVGDAMIRLTSNIATYTQSSTPITWYSASNPDSVRIVVLASSAFSPKAGTIMLVDNMTFTGAAGVNDLANEVSIAVYPNPTSGTVCFSSPENISVIEVYDLSGRMINAHQVNGKEAVINADDLNTGIYMYTVKDANNTAISRGKLNVTR